MTKQKKDTFKWIIVFVLIALIAGGTIFSVVTLRKNETSKTVSALSFEIGNLNESGGFNKNDTSTMVTKNMLKLEDIEIILPEDSGVVYKVFYFDEDGDFISSSEYLDTHEFKDEPAEGATQVKIVVKPVSDPEISFFEIPKYAKQITIKVSK